MLYLEWQTFPRDAVFAHACDFDRELMDSRLAFSKSGVHAYAILPWFPLLPPYGNNERMKTQKVAHSLITAYTPYVLPSIGHSFTNLSYFANLSARCNVTRAGLEHVCGFRLGV